MKRAYLAPSSWSYLAALCAFLSIAAVARGALAQRPTPSIATELIAEVRVRGNQRVPTSIIMSEIRTRQGVPPDQKLIDDDVKRLIATRQFFDVAVAYLHESHGLVVLFTVIEGNQIKSIEFEGNRELPSEKLRDKAGLNPPKQVKDKPVLKDRPFDIARVTDAARTLEDYYRDKGFPFASVTVAEGTKPGDARILFRVVEGPKVYIDDVDFEFLDHDTLGESLIATKTKTKPRRFGFYGGKYIVRDIDDDVQRLTAYFRSLGFFDAKVSRELRESPDRSKVTVMFVIFEGPRYNVRSIQFIGNSKLSADELTAEMKLEAGKPFNQDKLAADQKKVRDKYGHLGHLDVAQGGSLKIEPDVRFLNEPGQVDVVYQINEGDPYYVGRIMIVGNQNTQDHVFRRELRLYPGDLLDSTLVDKSIRNLNRTQLVQTKFQNGVGPQLEPIGDGPNIRDLQLRGDEAQTGRIMVGVGVNSDAGVIGNLVISEQNFDLFAWPSSFSDFIEGNAFRGAGQELRLEAAPGTQFSRYLVSWREPRLFDEPYSLGVSGYFFQRHYLDWNEDRGGGTITVGHEFSDEVRGNLGLRIEEIHVSNLQGTPTPPKDLLDVKGGNFLTAFTLGLEHDTRDSPFMATSGHLASVALEQGFGDFNFSKISLEGRQYWAITERPDGSGKQVLSLRGTVGFSGSNTPIFERFYAGGFRNFRGFEFRGIGPEENRVHVGGDFMALGSLEYQFPLTADDTLQWVFFSDFGTLEDDVRFSNARASVGFGLRVMVPMLSNVPLAFDFAFPLHKESTDDRQIFSFFIGIFR